MIPFIDVFFQSEISRYEDEEFEDYAKLNCNESFETRHKPIEDFRKMISGLYSGGQLEFYNFVYDRAEFIPRRMDDAYLLKFLRSRYFRQELAYRLLARYEDFRLKYSHLYKEVDAFGLTRIKGIFSGTYPDNPINGRIIIMKFGNWDPSTTSADDVLRCALLLEELVSIQPKLQILGVTIIIDLEGITMRHIAALRSTARNIVDLMGVSFPILNNGLHIINNAWIVNTGLNFLRQFIPKRAWSRIHLHGYDMQSLHKYIAPQYLPTEYAGTNNNVITSCEWLEKINHYKDEFLVRELRNLGYKVKDNTWIECQLFLALNKQKVVNVTYKNEESDYGF